MGKCNEMYVKSVGPRGYSDSLLLSRENAELDKGALSAPLDRGSRVSVERKQRLRDLPSLQNCHAIHTYVFQQFAVSEIASRVA